MATVLILIDAMRYDYVNREDTPFLYECSKTGEYYKRLVPSVGFCERTEILTGMPPRESGFLTAIGFDPDNSPYRGNKFLDVLELIEKLLPENIIVFGFNVTEYLIKVYRRILSKTLLKGEVGLYRIPLGLMRYFALTEDKIDHREANAFIKPSILSMLQRDGRKFFYDAFTSLNMPLKGSDYDRMQLVLKASKNSEAEFYMIYVTVLDEFGHKYGPKSGEIKTVIRNLDSELATFVQQFTKNVPDSQYIFLGDHGMVNVTEFIDAEKEVIQITKKLNLKHGHDYIIFLDSTIVRIWLISKISRQKLLEKISESEEFNKKGSFIDENMAKELNIPWHDRRYGDIMWLANPGVLVFPDFFHRYTPSKGMHGYNPKDNESHGTCIAYGSNFIPKKIDEAALTGIFDVLYRSIFSAKS